MCPECYDNANKNPEKYFVNVCKSKHEPVWAKIYGYPYWPAKVMHVNKTGKKILSYDVQFFGTYEIGRAVPYDQIKKYSVKHPNNYLNTKYQKDLDDCMPVHIQFEVIPCLKVLIRNFFSF